MRLRSISPSCLFVSRVLFLYLFAYPLFGSMGGLEVGGWWGGGGCMLLGFRAAGEFTQCRAEGAHELRRQIRHFLKKFVGKGGVVGGRADYQSYELAELEVH